MWRGGSAMALVAAAAVLAACPASHPAGRWDCGGNPCDDGDACNGVETCDAEVGCAAGTLVDCDDHDPCTVDSCAAAACSHTPRDLDADGHADRCAGGDDCAPEDPAVHPGAAEVCNDRDDDCDLEVDEGLAISLVESQTWEDRYTLPVLLLDDGTLVGVDARGLWTANAEGEARVPLVAGEPDVPGGGAPLNPNPRPAGLWRGAGGVLAALWGPVVPISPGQDEFFRHWDDVAIVAVDAAGTVESFHEVDPCGADRCLPTSLAAGNVGSGPVLAFGAVPDGVASVLLTPMEADEAEVRAVATIGRPVQRVALAGGSGGGLVFWTEAWPSGPAVLRVRALDAAARPAGPVVDLLDGLGVGLSACQSQRGAAVAIVAGGSVRLLLVEPTLVATEIASWSMGDAANPSVRCRGSDLWVLAGGHLRRLDTRTQETFDDLTGLIAPAFVEGTEIAVAGHVGNERTLEVRRYGCAR